MKHGPKTSEFWLTIATVVTTVANEILGMGISQEAMLSVVGSVAAYAGARAVAKVNQK